jgi:hypothetical protein
MSVSSLKSVFTFLSLPALERSVAVFTFIHLTRIANPIGRSMGEISLPVIQGEENPRWLRGGHSRLVGAGTEELRKLPHCGLK